MKLSDTDHGINRKCYVGWRGRGGDGELLQVHNVYIMYSL